VEQGSRALLRRAVLHARPSGHRHRSRLMTTHVGDRRGDDRMVRRCDAVLRHAERNLGLPNDKDVKDGIIATRSRPMRPTWRGIVRARRDRDDAISSLATTSTGISSSRCHSIRRRRSDARTRHCPTLLQQSVLLSMCGPKFCSMNYSAKSTSTTAGSRHREETIRVDDKLGGIKYSSN